jgi:hypothetical protein
MPKTPSKTGSSSPIATTASAFTAPQSSSSSSSTAAATEEYDIKIDKVKITPFSDSKDWESTVFELKLILQQVWSDKALDIIKFLIDKKYALSAQGSPQQIKADKLIYYVLSSGSVRGSFARNTTIAAQSPSAQPYIPDNAGLLLYDHFEATFVSNDEHATNLPIAQRKFHALKQKNNETASAYIGRVDLAVSDLTKLGEPVSHNTWIFTLANGLRPEFSETRKGVNFAKAGFQTVLEVKNSILTEESIYNNQPGNNKQKNDDKTDTAFMANDHKDKTCHYCNKKGHIAPDCRKKIKDKSNGIDVSKNQKGKGKNGRPTNSKGQKGKNKGNTHGSTQRGSYWCDHCQTTSHSTDYCRAQQKQPYYESFPDKGKGKQPSSKGKSYGRGQGWSKGNSLAIIRVHMPTWLLKRALRSRPRLNLIFNLHGLTNHPLILDS